MSYDREPDIDVDDLRKVDDRDDLLADLEAMSSDDYGSNAFITEDTVVDKKKKSKKKKREEETSSTTGSGDWFTDFMDNIHAAEVGATRRPRRGTDIEDIIYGKKKKKKKKKKKDGEPTDFKKEFETENMLYTNLLRDQTKFTASLQATYDALAGRKASGRGMTKNEQALIANITSARSLCTQLVDKRTNLKKLTTELSLKERKELGLGADLDGGGLGEFGSAYLKKLIDERHMLEQGGSDIIYDMDEDDVGEALQDRLNAPVDDKDKDLYTDTDRTTESEAYLRYENANITTYVSINSSDESDWYYVARDPEGNEVSDYPLPCSSIGSINRSTNIMTDEFGQKYQIEWR